MDNMFNGCSSLEYLDLYSFNTKSCSSFDGMFDGIEKLTIKINKEKCKEMIRYIPNYITFDNSTDLLR